MSRRGGCFANRCDWRLPTFVELQELADLNVAGCNSGSPCIDPVFGPTKPAIYWSNASVLESTGVLIVDFNDGKASEIFIKAGRPAGRDAPRRG